MSIPSSELGPPPLSRKRVFPSSSGAKRGGAHSHVGEGVGGPNSNDWRNSRYLGQIYVFRLFLCCDVSREVNYQSSLFLISPDAVDQRRGTVPVRFQSLHPPPPFAGTTIDPGAYLAAYRPGNHLSTPHQRRIIGKKIFLF